MTNVGLVACPGCGTHLPSPLVAAGTWLVTPCCASIVVIGGGGPRVPYVGELEQASSNDPGLFMRLREEQERTRCR